jgi:hypothetical protein
MSLELTLLLIPLCFLVAAAYATVGLGGGTGYLALMTLFGVSAGAMPSTALTLNLVVTGAALLRFGAAGRVRWRVLLPFLLPAIPAAFVGGWIVAPTRVFLAVLAAGLTAAGVVLLRGIRRGEELERPPGRRLWLVGLPTGIGIGVVSGFLGIGGGVFLGPLLFLLRWARAREIAAMNSATILIVSAVALAAHGARGAFRPELVAPLAAAVLVGGLLGAHLAETRLSERSLRRILAVIVLVAATRAALAAAGV